MIKNLSNMLKKKNSKKGFTLIELIVVIAILAILAAIAIPRLSGFNDKAKDAVADANARTLNSATAIYEANGNTLLGADEDSDLYDALVAGDLVQDDVDLTTVDWDGEVWLPVK